MAWDPDIWTGEVRRVLYRRLVRLFGPLATWEKANSPGRGRDEAYREFCTAFASAVGAKSGDAVAHQVRFAMPESKKGSIWDRHKQTAILNKAAALEAGFIEDRHLPTLLAVGPGSDPKQALQAITLNDAGHDLVRSRPAPA